MDFMASPLSDGGEGTASPFFQVNWNLLVKNSDFLSPGEYLMIEKTEDDKGLTELLKNSTSAREYSRLLVKIAENCSSDDGVLKFVFSKAQTILELNSAVTSSGTANRAELFKAADGSLPESSFKQAMMSSDLELRRAASRCLAFLLTKIPGDVDGFITWVVMEMASEDALTRIAQIVPAASIIFQIPQAREIFIAQGGVTHLVSMLSGIGTNGNAQQLYDLSFCLWMLSMSIKSGAPTTTFLSSGSIAVAADLLAAAPSRKVVRVVVAFLHNLGQTECAPVLTEMFAHGVQRYLENMVQSNALAQANDVEFEADAKDLYQTLMRNYRELSTFECWAAEVTSGKLRWGICHTEKFWRENARFLEDGDYKLLKHLIELLSTATDETTMCICLYDIGEFTRFYTGGRGITSTLGGKDVAMALIDHSNAEVARQALQCVSKVMVTNWEFMR